MYLFRKRYLFRIPLSKNVIFQPFYIPKFANFCSFHKPKLKNSYAFHIPMAPKGYPFVNPITEKVPLLGITFIWAVIGSTTKAIFEVLADTPITTHTLWICITTGP